MGCNMNNGTNCDMGRSMGRNTGCNMNRSSMNCGMNRMKNHNNTARDCGCVCKDMTNTRSGCGETNDNMKRGRADCGCSNSRQNNMQREMRVNENMQRNRQNCAGVNNMTREKSGCGCTNNMQRGRVTGGCGNERPERGCFCKMDGCDVGTEPVDKMAPGMGFVPWQKWEDVYCIEKGLERGTIFEQLDKPFLGGCAK